MARPKEFDRETALRAAVRTFADRGYEGTSTDDLLRAMGLSRQSMYDTFGDKRRLYLAALDHYQAEDVSRLIRVLNTAESPLGGIRAALLSFARSPTAGEALGCMGVSAVCEFGRSDKEITNITDAMGRSLQSALERRLLDAKALAEVDSKLDVGEAAQFLVSTLSGMKVSARGGASKKVLEAIALMAVRSLD